MKPTKPKMGRPRSPDRRVSWTISVKPEVKEEVIRRAKDRLTNPSRVIESLVERTE